MPLARPHRFSKTLLVSTLEAYFQGDLPKLDPGDRDFFDPHAGQRVALFKGTAIEDNVRRSRVHPVVRLNLAMTTAGMPVGLQAKLLEHMERLYTGTDAAWKRTLNQGGPGVHSVSATSPRHRSGFRGQPPGCLVA